MNIFELTRILNESKQVTAIKDEIKKDLKSIQSDVMADELKDVQRQTHFIAIKDDENNGTFTRRGLYKYLMTTEKTGFNLSKYEPIVRRLCSNMSDEEVEYLSKTHTVDEIIGNGINFSKYPSLISFKKDLTFSGVGNYELLFAILTKGKKVSNKSGDIYVDDGDDSAGDGVIYEIKTKGGTIGDISHEVMMSVADEYGLLNNENFATVNYTSKTELYKLFQSTPHLMFELKKRAIRNYISGHNIENILFFEEKGKFAICYPFDLSNNIDDFINSVEIWHKAKGLPTNEKEWRFKILGVKK